MRFESIACDFVTPLSVGAAFHQYSERSMVAGSCYRLNRAACLACTLEALNRATRRESLTLQGSEAILPSFLTNAGKAGLPAASSECRQTQFS
jgi:hypothetical protein